MDNHPTRHELHELVWRLPMREAAAQFAVPPRTLSKICKQYDIPVPPSGHWSKVKSGRPVQATPLPSPENDESVLFDPGARTRRNRLKNGKISRKTERREAWPQQTASLETYQPTNYYVAALQERIEAMIDGGATSICTHKRSEFRISVFPESSARTVRLLDQICMLSHTYSMDIRPSANGLAFFKDGYGVSIAVTEQVSSHRNPIGRLEVRLDNRHYNDGIQRHFADSRHTCLEEKVSSVAKSIVCSVNAGCERAGISGELEHSPVTISTDVESSKILERIQSRLTRSLVDLEQAARKCRAELLREFDTRKTNRHRGRRSDAH